MCDLLVVRSGGGGCQTPPTPPPGDAELLSKTLLFGLLGVCATKAAHARTRNALQPLEHPPNFTVIGMTEWAACRRRRGRGTAGRKQHL